MQAFDEYIIESCWWWVVSSCWWDAYTIDGAFKSSHGELKAVGGEF